MVEGLTNQTDSELLDRYCEGEEGAFSELVDRYKNGLYAFLRKFLNRHEMVEDVFQETFLQLYSSRESFDRSRPLRPWLFTIAANKAKDALRKAQRTAAVSIGTLAQSDEMSFEEVLNLLTQDDQAPIHSLQRQETAASVKQIIAELPEALRGILILAYFNQFSYKQIAGMLSIPIGTVKSRLHTAVARFAKEWKSSRSSEEG